MQKIRFDYNNMTSDYLGDEQGISVKELESNAAIAKKAFDFCKENAGKGMMGWTELATSQDEIVEDILTTAASIRKNYKAFVVLGIGGSALGPIAVFQALCHLHYNELPENKRGPKFYVEDNVDPERMCALLDVIDVKTTMFNVITKSGATSETMSQYLIITDLLKKALGDDFAKNVIATTDTQKGNLIKLAKKEGFKTYYIPASVGGRFSELCPVGLLPAAVLGVDIKELLAGVRDMQELSNSDDYKVNAPLCSALLQYLSMQKGKNISVMMPYADSLKYIADWYCQLWAESLGKAVDFDGKVVNVGQTPVKSLGVTDQHSQVQLYTEGPFDKVVTFIAVDKFRSSYVIPQGLPDFPDVNFLCGNDLATLLNNERVATEYALTKAKRANRTIYMPEVTPRYLGQLLYFFMLETAYCGAMLNIDAFNQPGVEEGKKATFALFDRKGFEEKKAELQSAKQKTDKFII